MTLPNFLVIGAQKAGTTSLYYYLGQHPEVFMSPVKETFFFDNEGKRQSFGGPGGLPPPKVANLGEYEALFAGAKREKAIGEASPSYIYVPGTPERINKYIPEAKFVALLRDPAERAYSAFAHAVRTGREPLRDFGEALEAEDERIKENWHYLYHYRRRGFYHEQLSRYYRTFDPGRIRVYLYEDLEADPVGVSQGVFRFLGVDDGFVPDTSTKYNVSGVARNKVIHALVTRSRRLTPALGRALPFTVRQKIKSRIFSKPPPIPQELREGLAEGYRDDVLKLQDLIGRDLSGWLA